MKKRSTNGIGLLWFGAAVSIAEIYTGTLLAPLGLARGIFAIAAGHLIGGALMYMAARIGAVSGKAAMESVKLSFGSQGAKMFASLNVLQLVGWTAVMIVGGASAADVLLAHAGFGGYSLWAVVIGCLIAFWIGQDMEHFERTSRIAVSALFLLCIALSFVVFRGDVASPADGAMGLGAALELSCAMPLSWLPLVADYVKDAEKPRRGAFVGTLVYGLTSCWMYVIGLGAALHTGQSDIARIMLAAGMGFAGLLTVVFSTVTTTYLDAWSGGVSASVIFNRVRPRVASLAICAAGTLLALLMPAEKYESYLYLISSVFCPMISIMIADFYFLKKNEEAKNFSVRNLLLWAFGFLLYRFFLRMDLSVGSTLPVMFLVILLAFLAEKIYPGKK